MTAYHESTYHGAEPVIFLINGSGAGLAALIGFLIFAAYMIAREAAR